MADFVGTDADDTLWSRSGDLLEGGEGTDTLFGVEVLAFGSNVFSAEDGLRVFAPRGSAALPSEDAGAAEPSPPPEQLVSAQGAAGAGSPAEEAVASEPVLVAHDVGLSWDEIAARVLANFEATGSRWF